jgi:hypothetical protein
MSALRFFQPPSNSNLRAKLYKALFAEEVLIFSRPGLDDPIYTNDNLYNEYTPFLTTRTGASALNIIAVNRSIRTEALPFLASMVTFDLGSYESVQQFRNTFPLDFRKSVEKITIQDDATRHFALPTTRLGWANLKSLTISGAAMDNVRDLLQGTRDIMPGLDTLVAIPRNQRTFTLYITAFVDESVETVVDMDNSTYCLASISSDSSRELRRLKAEEYEAHRRVQEHERTILEAAQASSDGAAIMMELHGATAD